MDRKIREIKTNKAWECYKSPAFTVITPVYNRKKLIGRAMASVEKQSFRDFEYIVIDDGSIEEESIDDIMEEFMERVSFPVMFIKKENGGVHTARNLGTVHGRGMLWCALDSDDCLLEDALEKMYCAWQEIPLGKRSQYYGVVTRCIDGNGQIIGKAIPAQINEQGWKTARKFKMSVKGELHGACAMQVMKKHLWPEPEGVTFVTESILWCYLDMKYRQYLTNKTTRTYYLDNAWEHLSGGGQKTVQDVKNAYWNSGFLLQKPGIFFTSKKEFWRNVLRYNTMKNILEQFGETAFMKKYKYTGKSFCVKSVLIQIISYLYSKRYIRKRMG